LIFSCIVDSCASAWRRLVFARSSSCLARSSQRGLRLYHFFFLSGDVQVDLPRPLPSFVTQAVRLRVGLLEQYLQLAAIQRGEHFLADDQLAFLFGERVELGGQLRANRYDLGFNAGVVRGDIP
jgi:hypothetical protein